MILMGNRSGPSEDIKHINHELRVDIKDLPKEDRERIGKGGPVYVDKAG